jgi:hypothetical protein
MCKLAWVLLMFRYVYENNTKHSADEKIVYALVNTVAVSRVLVTILLDWIKHITFALEWIDSNLRYYFYVFT